MGRRSPWVGRLALVLGGLFTGLVAAEVGFRAARPDDAVDLLYNASLETYGLFTPLRERMGKSDMRRARRLASGRSDAALC